MVKLNVLAEFDKIMARQNEPLTDKQKIDLALKEVRNPATLKGRVRSADLVNDPGAPLEERGKTHGPYAVDAATAMGLKSLFRAHQGWDNLSPSQQNSLDLIATKIGRILSGNPNHDDHWRDIGGYAMLICNELFQAQK